MEKSFTFFSPFLEVAPPKANNAYEYLMQTETKRPTEKVQ